MSGIFVMVDGLDGSGKGIIVMTLAEHLEARGKKIFDLRQYCKKHGTLPEVNDIKEFDVIISAEPTYSLVGRALREEIIRKQDRIYSGISTAHAYALDREILYRKLIIPSLKEGKIILQERGVITSLVYQPVQMEQISLHDIMNLPGNRLALKTPPNLLVITRTHPEVAMARLDEREKKDHAIFENLSFQQKIELRYESDWLKKIFESIGTKVSYMDTNGTIEETKANIVRIFEEQFGKS